MAGLPISLGDLITIINGCISIYNTIKGADDQIDDVGDRLQDVLDYVRPIEQHLNDKYSPAKHYAETKVIRALVAKMKADAESIKTIFKRYRDDASKPFTFGRILFVYGSSPRKLEYLITTIERRADRLDHQVNLMDHAHQQQQLQRLNHKPLIGTVKNRMVDILFVDNDNTGRSVVSHAHTLLLAQWTKRTGGTWNVRMCNSSGLYIRDSLLVDEQKQILAPTDFDSAKANLPPNQHAMDALFDNKLFNYPYKEDVKKNCGQHRSRSFRKDSFKQYDYILVYTFKKMEELLGLKALVKRKYGPEWTPKEKGKIVLLGQYRDGKSVELVEPRDNTRAGWDWCVPRLKLSFKNWLKEELQWVQPPQDAKQDKPI